MITPLRRNAPVLSSLNLIAGIWLLFSPLFIHFSTVTASRSNVIVGFFITVISAMRALGYIRSPSWSWINALLGLYAFVLPWAGKFTPPWGNLTAGLVVVILSITCGIISEDHSWTVR